MKKRLLSLILLLSMVLTAILPASAYMYPASNIGSLSIVCYPLDSSSRNITAYSSSGMTAKVGTVYGTDRITILAAAGTAVKVRFPVSGGTKEGWIPVSAVSKGALNTGYSLAMRAGGAVTVYRYETGSSTLGSISANDTIYLVYAGTDHTNGRCQFIYPVGSTWKMGWVNFSDLDKYDFRATGCSQTVRDGEYKIYVSGTHCVDGDAPDNNVHVWEALDVPQQTVTIVHRGNGKYTVQFKHNGLYLDQQGGVQQSSTLWGYPYNGTAAQLWYIADLGNGRWALFNVNSGLALDVQYYRTTSNNADIMAYHYNGQSVTLKRSDGGAIRTDTVISNPISTRQQAMVDHAMTYLGKTGYSGLCQKFVRSVGQDNGLPHGGADSALQACSMWRVSTSLDNIPVGAAVYLRGKSGDGYKYGHVGIYIGDGKVIHAQSTVRIDDLSTLLKTYTYLGWGWQAGVDLR